MIIKSEFPPVEIASRPFNDTLLECIWSHSIDNPARPALISAENESDFVTFRDIYVYAYSVASFLEEIHFGHRDIACAILPNCWEFVPIILGCHIQGGALSGASHLFTDYELRQQFLDLRAKVVFCEDVGLNRVLKAAKECPDLQHIVVVEKGAGYRAFPFGVKRLKDILKVQPKLNKPTALIDVEKDLLILPYSSGTTGSPKGVMLSHKTFGTKMNIFYEHMTTQIFRKMDPNWDWRKENVCLLLPFYHIYGIGVLMTSLRGGSTGVILRQFQPEIFCRTLQNYKMSHACLVPPVLVFLAKSPIVDKYKFPNLKFIMTGAAPSGRELLEEVQKRIPSLKQIAQAYGMTEESMASHLPVWGKINHSSAGRLMALFEMKIVDVTTRQPLPLGQVGEICCRSPTIMLGYYRKPQATAEAIDEEGWLKTGDLGYQDAEGWTYVVDRLKELIKVKGHQVAPAELEDLLLSHPDIRDCAVIGVPDAKAGEVPKAFVDRANNRLTEQQVADYVKDKLIQYKHLAGGVEFIDEVPKSAAGKILRRFLRDREAKKRSKL